MDWFKKHTDTVIILSGILASVFWMNTQFNRIDKDLAVIKTVLVMKNIMPVDLAKCKEEEK